MAETTIGVSKKLKKELERRKLIPEETYESVIWRALKGDKNEERKGN